LPRLDCLKRFETSASEELRAGQDPPASAALIASRATIIGPRC